MGEKSKPTKLPKATVAFAFADKKHRKSKKYECAVRFDDLEDIKEYTEIATQLAIDEFGEKKAKKCKFPWGPEKEGDGILFKSRSSFKPVAYNAKGEKLNAVPNIWKGSVVRLGIQFETYVGEDGGPGVTARFNGIQIIKLVKGGASFDFEADADAEDAYTETEVESDRDDDDEDDEDDKPQRRSKKSKDDEDDDDKPRHRRGSKKSKDEDDEDDDDARSF